MGCCTARPKDETKETSNYIPYYNISFKEDLTHSWKVHSSLTLGRQQHHAKATQLRNWSTKVALLRPLVGSWKVESSAGVARSC